jgi:O-antigen/teichoic acid export membrane protein
MSMFEALYLEHKETAQNFFWRNIQIFIKGAVSLAIFFLAAKWISPEKFGLLNYSLVVMSLLGIFCDFGISTATAKFVAEYKAINPRSIHNVLYSVFIPIIGITFIISLSVLLFGRIIFKENYIYIILLLPYLILTPLTSTLDGFYRGLKDFKKLSFVYLVTAPVSLGIAIFLIRRYFMYGAIFSYNVLILLPAVSLFMLRGYKKIGFEMNILKEISKYSVFIGLGSISYFMYTNVDILIMKQFNYVVEIGYYGIIDRLFILAFMPAVILGEVIAPNTAKYIALKDYFTVKNKFLKYLVFISSIAIPVSIVLYFVVPLFLKFVLPQYYTKAFIMIFNILLILLPIKILGVFMAQGFVTPAGYVKVATIFTFIGGICNIIFDYIFIWLFGFIGVFLTKLIIHSLCIFLICFVFYRKLNLAV